MLKYRVLTALILIPIFIALVLKLSPIAFCIFTGAMILWGAWEWSALMGLQKKSARFLYVFSVLALLVGTFELPLMQILYVAFVWWLVALVLVLIYPKTSAKWGKNWVITSLMGFLVLIPCWLAINYIRNAPDGISMLLYVFILIWGADTGAYFAGRKWGKNKLAPAVSPGKTWEGLTGALVTTLFIAAGALFLAKVPYKEWFIGMTLAVITVLFSVLGDLFESMLKRNTGLKDSGTLLPGHGGLLDRIDSLTAAAPIFALGATQIGKFFQ
jgi:phosphatidate cytidylyltransferase